MNPKLFITLACMLIIGLFGEVISVPVFISLAVLLVIGERVYMWARK